MQQKKGSVSLDSCCKKPKYLKKNNNSKHLTIYCHKIDFPGEIFEVEDLEYFQIGHFGTLVPMNECHKE